MQHKSPIDAGLLAQADSNAKHSSSRPYTPSTGSSPSSTGSNLSKRSWTWSYDEASNSESEPDLKRVNRRSTSPISVAPSSGRLSLASSDHLRLPRERDDFLDFLDRPETTFVDKTQCILDLPDKFQCLLLRPPRFGKTTLLSTLHHYYDIHAAEHFDERFGSLAVVVKASNPAPRHNHHLCLSFNLSAVGVYSDIKDSASQLSDQISHVLNVFLIKYDKELGLSDPLNYLAGATLDVQFAKVFDLVQARGRTLFVGVDNYDAPTRTSTFDAHIDYPVIYESFGSPREIESLLDSSFWYPLLAGSRVIDKLWITGTVLVRYPALENLDFDTFPGQQSACGFTEEEALLFTKSLLDEVPNLIDLRCLCGQYTFPSRNATSGTDKSILHPQLHINRIYELSLHRPYADKRSFQLLSDILKVLPEESDVPGAVTLNDLIELLAAGTVDIGAEISSPFDYAATKAITWSTLYFAGAVTCDPQSVCSFRVVNSVVLSMIHSCVDKLFSDRHQLGWEFLGTWHKYNLLDDRQPFLDLMSDVLCDQTQRSFGRKREAELRGIFELVMRNSCCAPDKNPIGPLILPPVDVPRVEIPAYASDKVHIWELKTLTLRGMWEAANPNDDEPTVEALKTLHKELVDLEEDDLLGRPYRVWSPTLNAMETVPVGSFFDPESEVPQFLAVGGARVLMRPRPRQDIRPVGDVDYS
ncbi:AAA-ATPase-like domain-containing protein [Mycena venus]|uniref:AAA-ATPase-like domain-containing protein n=1 Tax=Mycena venus TaxID=2733690 RepID=A0A8H6YB60_9AGAR|nr:AAA-ATPase-like domain-containing protein [Mycena venus]